jgi:hypothetical protein
MQRHGAGQVPFASLFFFAVLSVVLTGQTTAMAQNSVQADVAAIKQVGPVASGYEAAMAAAKRLSSRPSSSTAELLASMKDASPLAKNWLRMIAADVADNDEFPLQLLLDFFANRAQDADARHAAYQMLVIHDGALKAKLLEGSIDDPSLPIRHAAIAKLLDEAAKHKEAKQNDAALQAYRLVVSQGRNPDQLQAAAKALDSLGEKIELADELGLFRRWWAIGVFDNTDSAHFETVYLPEQTYAANGRLPTDWLAAEAVVVPDAVDGKPAVTNLVTSDDSFGVVNINPAFNNAKDAIAYCYAEFDLAEGSEALAKLGCITASKVWVNGKLVMANEVYHSGSRIDQYVGQCTLVPGTNSVLIKICQNAQTEQWAQDWQFQFRFTDLTEAAIKPKAVVRPK